MRGSLSPAATRAGLLARRQASLLLLPLLGGLLPPTPPALADVAAPHVTRRVELLVTVGAAEPRALRLGLYGEEAPASTELFAALCQPGGLAPPDGGRAALPLSYRGSVASRVEPGVGVTLGRLSAGSAQTIDRSIDGTGYVRSELVDLAAQYPNADRNTLSHGRAGLVSMRRGGGDFEFLVTTAANPSLDAERLVVGEVETASLPLLDAMAAVPVRRPARESGVGGLVFALGAYDEGRYLAVARAGGDPRARIETAYKPLQKIKISATGLLP